MTDSFYTQLDPDTAELCQQSAARIHGLAKKTAALAIQIGEELADVKAVLPHGHFSAWLRAEFDWNERTARRYMQVAEAFKTDNLSDLNISLSALQLLASPSVSEDDRQTALQIARDNGGLRYTDARELLLTPLPGDLSPLPLGEGPGVRGDIAGVRGFDNSAYLQLPPQQTIIFSGDVEPPDDGDGWLYAEPQLPLQSAHVRLERVTVTESMDIELRQPTQLGLPLHLQSVVYIDPVTCYSQPPRLEAALEQLHAVYFLATGRHYIYRSE